MTTIKPATSAHVERLLSIGLRADDAGSFGTSPEVAVREAFEASTKAWTLLATDDSPVAVWGVIPWPGKDGVGAPWFAATDAVGDHASTLRHSATQYIQEMGAEFPVLSNFIDAKHADAIGWLKRVGFRFDTSVTLVGPERSPFIQFGIHLSAPPSEAL